MKKVAVITLHRTSNYGGVLQPFALQKALQKTGLECEIIDYYPEENTVLGQLKRLKVKSEKMKNPILYCGAFFAFSISYLKKKLVFEKYIKKYLNLSSTTYRTVEDFEKEVPFADIYCSGGDQVFHGVNEARFFPFVKNKPIVSYSASFGKNYIDVEYYERIKSYLDRYRLLSVREDSGLEILQQMGYKSAEQVLDSTLLMNEQDWSPYISDKYNKKKYILTYNLHHDCSIDKFAKELSDKYNLPVYNICMHWFEFYRFGKNLWCPQVEDYLSLFKNAEFVIGDSFHGTVFSILFKKQFLSILPNLVGTRIDSIARVLGLEDRVIKSHEKIPLSKIEKKIDYPQVYNKLETEKEHSFTYLKKISML